MSDFIYHAIEVSERYHQMNFEADESKDYPTIEEILETAKKVYVFMQSLQPDYDVLEDFDIDDSEDGEN